MAKVLALILCLFVAQSDAALTNVKNVGVSLNDGRSELTIKVDVEVDANDADGFSLALGLNGGAAAMDVVADRAGNVANGLASILEPLLKAAQTATVKVGTSTMTATLGKDVTAADVNNNQSGWYVLNIADQANDDLGAAAATTIEVILPFTTAAITETNLEQHIHATVAVSLKADAAAFNTGDDMYATGTLDITVCSTAQNTSCGVTNGSPTSCTREVTIAGEKKCDCATALESANGCFTDTCNTATHLFTPANDGTCAAEANPCTATQVRSDFGNCLDCDLTSKIFVPAGAGTCADNQVACAAGSYKAEYGNCVECVDTKIFAPAGAGTCTADVADCAAGSYKAEFRNCVECADTKIFAPAGAGTCTADVADCAAGSYRAEFRNCVECADNKIFEPARDGTCTADAVDCATGHQKADFNNCVECNTATHTFTSARDGSCVENTGSNSFSFGVGIATVLVVMIRLF